MIGADLTAAAIALLCAGLAPRRRGSAGPPIIALCLGAAGWSLAAAWAVAYPEAITGANACMLAAAAISAASAYVAARRLTTGAWRVPPALLVVFLAEPVLMVFLRFQRFPDLTSAEFRQTWVFFLHVAYCFILLLSVILTLNARQRDPERRVRIFVLISQVLVISIIALEVAANEQTHFVVVGSAVLAVWVARHPEDWTTSTARADSLLNSIGLFLFVFDAEGRLRDWNGTAGRLIELITGTRPHRDMTSRQLLGQDVPFEDDLQIDLELRGGRMRTSAHIHAVDPTVRAEQRSWVVLLKPVRSSVDQASFPSISGSLAGHDPGTQTLGRRALVDELGEAVSTGRAAVRVDVFPTDPGAREDEVMFVVARRLEMMFPQARWGRLATWTFAAVFDLDAAWPAKYTIDIETRTAVGLAATVETTVCAPTTGEDPARFVLRVDRLRDRPAGVVRP